MPKTDDVKIQRELGSVYLPSEVATAAAKSPQARMYAPPFRSHDSPPSVLGPTRP